MSSAVDFKALRLAAGLSRKELSNLAGVSVGSIYNAEKNPQKTRGLVARALLTALQSRSPEAPQPSPLDKAIGAVLNELFEEVRRVADSTARSAIESTLASLKAQTTIAVHAAPAYVPPPPQTPAGLAPVDAVTKYNLPVASGATGWAIKYEARFLRDFKKLNATREGAAPEYEFRINRGYRILVQKLPEERAYVMTRIVHHDDLDQ